MSKLDIARNISLESSRERQIPEKELSEGEILELRLRLLQQQDMEKLKSNSELMKTLRDLLAHIKGATSTVQQAAQEVRDYPAESIDKAAARIEKAVRDSLKTAEEAQRVYSAAQRIMCSSERWFVWYMLGAALLSGMLVSGVVIFALR